MTGVGISVGTVEERKTHAGTHGVHGSHVGMGRTRKDQRFPCRHIGDDDVKAGNVFQQNVLGGQETHHTLQFGEKRGAVVEPPRRLKRKEVPHVHVTKFLKLRLHNHWVNFCGTQPYGEHHREKGSGRGSPVFADIGEGTGGLQVNEGLRKQDAARSTTRKQQAFHS